MFKTCLEKLTTGEHLTREESALALEKIICGEISATEIGGFLVGLRAKGESVEEILGLVDTMEKHMVKVDLADQNAIDVCGTGGDATHSFNVSTTVAIVAAAGGVSVAKHGNRSVSSKTGSADLLQELGIKIDLQPEHTKQCVDEIGIGFFFAPLYHPAMKIVAPHRKSLGMRTVFNMLGPLLNPARVRRQLIGAYDLETARKLAGVLKMRGHEKACTVHSSDGFDEISPFAQNSIFEVSANDEQIKEYYFGQSNGNNGKETVTGFDARKNAEITLAAFSGENGPVREMTVLNSAFAFYVADKVKIIDEGAELAKAVIDSGLALKKLHSFVEMTNSFD